MEGEKRRDVRVVKSSTVVPEAETARHTIWLSNLDLTATRGYAPTFYVYKSNGDPGFFAIEALEASLRKALVPFYPLAGGLVAGRDGRVEIDCNGRGVLLLEAESQVTLDDFGGFVPSSDLREMLVPAPPSGDPPCDLLLLQVTRFKCGGITLGVALHHAAADGLAALHFINTWADMARGVADAPALLPFMDRSLLRARSPPRVLFEHPEYRIRSVVSSPPATSKPFSTAVLHLSDDQLSALKRTCGHARLSTFKAVVAHVWRCACVARLLPGDVESRLHMAADARTRLDPPLPPGFFGNAVFRTSVAARVGDVLSDALERTASRIVEATSKLGDEYGRSLVDFLELQGDLRKLAKGSWTPPATDFWVVSWLGLPLYEADFGWGRPAIMRRACLQFSGLFYIMRSPKMDGGVSLALSLENDRLPAFGEAFYRGLSGATAADK